MQRTTRSLSDSEPDLSNTELLDYEMVGAILKCSPRMVRKLVDTRRLASVKVGALVRIEPQAIDDFIAENRREAM
jgi:excisionase family DNA binding protein